jgi:mono/diheme cytochrome c family protein
VSRLSDIVLPSPIGTGWLHGVLLFTFSLHFLFVALTLGTALLATIYYVAGQWGGVAALEGWDRELLRSFFKHKSLAIVLGVGPILLMQVGHSIPFLTGVNAMAPLWMSITICLIAALALYEWQHHRKKGRKWQFLLVSAVALTCLLYVPATFVAVLVTTERPRSWATILKLGGQLPLEAAVHWFLRFLHVLGASLLVTAAFNYLVEVDEQKRRHMLGWMAGSLAFQFVVGVALYGSVRPFPTALATAAMLVGVAAATLLGVAIVRWRQDPGQDRWPSRMLIAVLLPFVLVPMFLTRQLLQDRILVPFEQALHRNAQVHSAHLQPFRGPALAAFQASLATPYDDGLAIYTRSCAFCHGAVGNGQGDLAGQLDIPPEDLTRLRMGDAKLNAILLAGVDGTAMPRFDYYLDSELGVLRTFLREKVGLRRAVEPVRHALTAPAREQAREVFAKTCTVCHGDDGHGSERGRAMRPAPPDFADIALAPSRAFQIITDGYPGTLMHGYPDLPAEVRWALVERVQRFYRGEVAATGETSVEVDASVPEAGR